MGFDLVSLRNAFAALVSRQINPMINTPKSIVIQNMKCAFKNLVYRYGVLGIYHRIRNRKYLTVAMFHRVLPPSDPRYASADPEWTMTPDTFAHCLDFFRRHYTLVSPREVFAALRGETTLPDRSLLVTFDDGWGDTAEYAHPLLEKFSVPALIFVAAGAVDRTVPFWEERVYGFLTTRSEDAVHLQVALERHGISITLPASAKMTEKSIRSIIQQLGRSDKFVIESVLDTLNLADNSPPAMLNAETLNRLAVSSHVIGGHGMTHQPLTKISNLEKELKNAQTTLSSYLNGCAIEAMSFPHGAYSNNIVAASRSTGYRYLFSSDACLNSVEISSDKSGPLGRIHISERAITDHKGRFQPAMLATSLFLRSYRKNGLLHV